jgi:Cu(I)/Ag(I) efflux system membrane protein CusA/SilA
MINRLIELCAEHRLAVILLTAALVMGGVWALQRVPLDAIPDLSDPQVILYTEWPGRSPNLVEDQITYPIVSAMLAAPKVVAVRGISDYGFSYVYVIFEEGTDIYWGRSRVLEYMGRITGELPEGVVPKLGPDATGVGWAFQYVLVDRSGRHNLAELRSFNDWYMRYWLESVPGVAEVATLGGFVRQYQVHVDPNRLLAYRVPLDRVLAAVREGNTEVGGRVVEMAGREYIVRGRGYIRSLDDIRQLPVMTDGAGRSIRVGDVARVEFGPEMRRGIAEWNGEGEVTGGIVVVRYGESVMDVIGRVKAKLEEVRPSLPEGVTIEVAYDRTELIQRSIDNLKRTLLWEMAVVAVVILIFLWHIPSSLIPILTIPIAVVLSFIPMYWMGVTSNIMSLGGIAIAIGAMVDAAIVVVEQAHKKLERWHAGGRPGSSRAVIIEAVKEVGGPSFFALLVIAVSFMPVFALQYQEGRLFKPLAFTKNFSMAIAAVLAVTLGPALLLLLIRGERFQFRPRWLAGAVNAVAVGTFHPEDRHPISRVLMWLYRPVVRFVLRNRYLVVVAAAAIALTTIPVYQRLGSEFMPPLNEGSILYMPVTLPGISITEAGRYLQLQDKLIAQVPEVQSVFGKIGRAETATDPAPLAMVETTIVLKPPSEWRTGRTERWYSSWAPDFVRPMLNRIWPEVGPMRWEDLIEELDRTVRLPAFANAWLFPVRTRIDMITTGLRTPVGIKVLGTSLEEIERVGIEVERALQQIPGTRSAFFERLTGGYYLDFHVRREEAARYGLTVGQVHDVVEAAVGGKNVTTTVEGRERYPVNVRYARELRSSVESLNRVLVPTPSGAQVPLGQLAELTLRTGPPMIRNEEGFLAGFVYVDVVGRDLGGYVAEARQAVADSVPLPAGAKLLWSGQFEYMERAAERLWLIVPATLVIVFFLLYVNTGSMVKTLMILFAVPFAAVGAFWLLYLLDYNMSIAVWVGLIALLGVDAETSVFMLLYLDMAYQDRKKKGQMISKADLDAAIEEGAVLRIRPKVMTVVVTFLALLPIMWSTGTGADVMKRIAAPMVGGIFSSFLLELAVFPALFSLWKWHAEVKRARAT